MVFQHVSKIFCHITVLLQYKSLIRRRARWHVENTLLIRRRNGQVEGRGDREAGGGQRGEPVEGRGERRVAAQAVRCRAAADNWLCAPRVGGKFCLNYVSLCVRSWALRHAAPVDDCARAVLVGGEKRYAGIMLFTLCINSLPPSREALVDN